MKITLPIDNAWVGDINPITRGIGSPAGMIIGSTPCKLYPPFLNRMGGGVTR